MEDGQAQRSFHRSHPDLTGRLGIVPGPRKVPPFFWLFPVFPNCRNAFESLGRAIAVYPARLFLPGVPAHPLKVGL